MAPTSDHIEGRLWDVFLSHAGQQKWEFVSHLRALFKQIHPEVQIFVDDWSLQPGRKADPNITRAMDACGVFVVVLSKAFVWKSWPMREVGHIRRRVEARSDSVYVIPVMYDIRYDELCSLRRLVYTKPWPLGVAPDPQLDQEQAQRDVDWLLEYTALRPDQDARHEEAELVRRLVDDTMLALRSLGRLPLHSLDLPSLMFGRDEMIEELCKKRDRGVAVVVLHGHSGLGKTALADAVLERLRPDYCRPQDSLQFRLQLHDIAVEKDAGRSSMLKLQKSFLGTALHVEQVELLRLQDEVAAQHAIYQRLKRKQVLLVLDDLQSVWQLEQLVPAKLLAAGGLAAGSLVLVTTRDTQCLSHSAPEPWASKLDVVPVQGLEEGAAWAMFCWHAFEKLSLPPHLVHLEFELQALVARCQGVPQVLKVAASQLQLQAKQKSKKGFGPAAAVQYAVERMGKELAAVAGVGSQAKGLELTFSVLESGPRALLLDIAACLCGMPWDMVSAFRESELDELEAMALVYKMHSAGGCVVAMHDSVQELCLQHLAAGAQDGRRLQVAGNRRTTRTAGSLPAPVDHAATGDIVAVHIADCNSLGKLGSAGSQLRLLSMVNVGSEVVEQVHKDFVTPGLRQLEMLHLDRVDFPVGSPLSVTNLLVAHLQVVCLHAVHLLSLDGQALRQVRYLVLGTIPFLEAVDNLHELHQLEALKLHDCPALYSLEGLPTSVQRLHVEACPKLATLTAATQLHLHTLCVQHCPALSSSSLVGQVVIWVRQQAAAARQLMARLPELQLLELLDVELSTGVDFESADVPDDAGDLQQRANSKCDVFVTHTLERRSPLLTLLSERFQEDFPDARFVFQGPGQNDLPEDQVQQALKECRVGVVILSQGLDVRTPPSDVPDLHLLLERERSQALRLVPVWYDLTKIDLLQKALQYESRCQQSAREYESRWQIKMDQSDDNWGWSNWRWSKAMAEDLDNMSERRKPLTGDGEHLNALVDKIAQSVTGHLVATGGVSARGTRVGIPRMVGEIRRLLSHHPMLLLHGVAGSGKTVLLDATFFHVESDGTFDVADLLLLKHDTKEAELCAMQKRLLEKLDCKVLRDASNDMPAANHALLRQHLAGKRVWLVVDNAWGNQLQQLLPTDVMKVVGHGSKVLVASRERTAAQGFSGKTAHPLPKLTEDEAVEAFWRHHGGPEVAKSRRPVKRQKDVEVVVHYCKRVPMSVAVVAKLLCQPQQQHMWSNLPATLAKAFQQSKAAGRHENDGMTMNSALQLTFTRLPANAQEALLRTQQYLRGKRARDVAACFGRSALELLVSRGLLEEVVLAEHTTPVVSMSEAVVVFCNSRTKASRQQQPQRPVQSLKQQEKKQQQKKMKTKTKANPKTTMKEEEEKQSLPTASAEPPFFLELQLLHLSEAPSLAELQWLDLSLTKEDKLVASGRAAGSGQRGQHSANQSAGCLLCTSEEPAKHPNGQAEPGAGNAAGAAHSSEGAGGGTGSHAATESGRLGGQGASQRAEAGGKHGWKDRQGARSQTQAKALPTDGHSACQPPAEPSTVLLEQQPVLQLQAEAAAQAAEAAAAAAAAATAAAAAAASVVAALGAAPAAAAEAAKKAEDAAALAEAAAAASKVLLVRWQHEQQHEQQQRQQEEVGDRDRHRPPDDVMLTPKVRVLLLSRLRHDTVQLQALQHLRLVALRDLPFLARLRLSGLPALDTLEVSCCHRLTLLEGLADQVTLRDLHLITLPRLPAVPGLATLAGLRELHVEGLGSMTSLGDLGGLEALERVCVRDMQWLTGLRGLEGLTGLRSVELDGVGGVEDLPRVEAAEGLTRLRWRKQGAQQWL